MQSMQTPRNLAKRVSNLPKGGGLGRQGEVNAKNRAGRRGKDHANPPAKRQLRGCDRAAV